MCWALYLASDREIPRIEWNETNPALGVLPLPDSDTAVLARFDLPNVVYLASQEGCSCGFVNHRSTSDDARRLREAVLQQLSELLTDLGSSGARLQLFLCWEGEQGDPAQSMVEITPARFLADVFPMTGRQVANIV